MCMGPKCPCIYPQMPHNPMPYVTFRSKSPVDKKLIEKQLSTFSQTFLTKLRYTIRPNLGIQYSSFALLYLLGFEVGSWIKVPSAFFSYNELKNSIGQLKIEELDQKQIQNAEYWMKAFENLKEQQKNRTFADIVKCILEKVKQHNKIKQQKLIQEQEIKKQQQLIEQQLRQQEIDQIKLQIIESDSKSIENIATAVEEPSDLKIKQEEFPEYQNKRQFKSFKTYSQKFNNYLDQDSVFVQEFNIQQEQSDFYDDVQNLKVQLKMSQQDIHYLEARKKQKLFLMDREGLSQNREKEKDIQIKELKLNMNKKKENDFTNTINTYRQRQEMKDIYEFRRQLRQGERNASYDAYLKKYSGKYIEQVDRQEQEQWELGQVKSQLLLTQKIRNNLI